MCAQGRGWRGVKCLFLFFLIILFFPSPGWANGWDIYTIQSVHSFIYWAPTRSLALDSQGQVHLAYGSGLWCVEDCLEDGGGGAAERVCGGEACFVGDGGDQVLCFSFFHASCVEADGNYGGSFDQGGLK